MNVVVIKIIVNVSYREGETLALKRESTPQSSYHRCHVIRGICTQNQRYGAWSRFKRSEISKIGGKDGFALSNLSRMIVHL